MAHKNYEINSLRRALTEKGYMEQELNSLSDVLAKKNSEILSLKEASFEKEKFNKDNQLLAK